MTVRAANRRLWEVRALEAHTHPQPFYDRPFSPSYLTMASIVFWALAAAAAGVATPVITSLNAREMASEISGQRGCGPRGWATAICCTNTLLIG